MSRQKFYIIVGGFGKQKELFSRMISYLYHRGENISPLR